MEKLLTLGIPKGSLEELSLTLFSRAGFVFSGSERSLWLTSNDPEIRPVLLRPQEIPLYVASGSLDCGLSGLDWITETNCGDYIRVLADLCFSKRSFRLVRWVLAVSEDSPYHTLGDLRDAQRKPIRVATELKAVTQNWLSERGIVAEVDFSWGATEAKVPVFADAIVECTESGESLRANNLRIIDVVFESTTQFFANRAVYKDDSWKSTKCDEIALLLRGCLTAETKTNIRVLSPPSLARILTALIPSEASFAAWESGDGEVTLIEMVVDKEQSRDIVPALARNGASSIVVGSVGMLHE